METQAQTPSEATATLTRADGVQALLGIVRGARRLLVARVRTLEPGLFDNADVLDALRALAVRNPGRAEIRLLVQDAAELARAPLLPLAQRLSSSFLIREADDAGDRAYPSAFVANDAGGWWFRPLAGAYSGQTALGQPGAAKQLREDFLPAWERSRACSELRALGL